MLTIRAANQDDRVIVAEHLRHIALEVGISEDSIRQDWLEKTIEFIDRARQELRYDEVRLSIATFLLKRWKVAAPPPIPFKPSLL